MIHAGTVAGKTERDVAESQRVQSMEQRSGDHDPERYFTQLMDDLPGLRIVHKSDDWFSKTLDGLLRVVTAGGQSAYTTRYVTTIGRTIYLPTRWSARTAEDRYVTLRHEAVHLRQFRRYSLVGMSLLYLLPVLPMGLAYGRARLEWEAYEETLRATAEVWGIDAARSPELRHRILDQFTGPAYGWMWPFRGSIARWIDEALAEIERELP